MPKVSRKYGAAELRRASRAPAAKRTIVHLCRAGEPELAMRVTVRDFSDDGIGFICAKKLAAGDRFYLEPMKHVAGGARQWYAVAHCRSVGKVSFIIGAQAIEVGAEATRV